MAGEGKRGSTLLYIGLAGALIHFSKLHKKKTFIPIVFVLLNYYLIHNLSGDILSTELH